MYRTTFDRRWQLASIIDQVYQKELPKGSAVVTSLLGIDLGTSSVKAALFEADSLHHSPPYIHEIQKNTPAITSNISGFTPLLKDEMHQLTVDI